jgi:hypothetical protein
MEINGSFYSLQRPESYRAWYEADAGRLRLSIKGSLSPKGRDGWLMRRAPAAPLVVNEPISCSNPIASAIFCFGRRSWRFATRPSPNKKAAHSPKRIKLPR